MPLLAFDLLWYWRFTQREWGESFLGTEYEQILCLCDVDDHIKYLPTSSAKRTLIASDFVQGVSYYKCRSDGCGCKESMVLTTDRNDDVYLDLK